MKGAHNQRLTGNSQRLRRGMTKEERHLWYDFLKRLPVTFNRQKVIGDYIVDFFCASARLVIELDGSQHYDEKGKESDAKRDEYLGSLGLTVKRYSNADINAGFDSVCADIYSLIRTTGLDTSSGALRHLPGCMGEQDAQHPTGPLLGKASPDSGFADCSHGPQRLEEV